MAKRPGKWMNYPYSLPPADNLIDIQYVEIVTEGMFRKEINMPKRTALFKKDILGNIGFFTPDNGKYLSFVNYKVNQWRIAANGPV